MLGLKYKFMLVAAVIVALSSLIWGGWIMHNEEKILLENTINKSRLVVTSFKDSIISAIIDDEQNNNGRGSLDSIIEEIVDNTQFQAVYAYVSDVGGVVVAHNNMAECGKTYQDPLASDALEKDLLQYGFSGPLHNVSSTIDMAVPLGVNGKRWGVLRAGFSLKPLNEQLNYQRNMVWTLSVIMCLVEVSIFYLLGLNLTKPLQELTYAMAVVDPAVMDKRLTKTKRVDEIGVLYNSFRAMLEKLKKTEVERQRAMISLVQTEKLAIVGKLVAGVAHEINNPLAAIESCLYNLKQNETWRNNSDLAILQQARKQIENIVLQLLDFSRAGQLFLEEVQSDSFFTEMACLAEMAIKKKHVILKKHDLCDPPQLLTIDISKITQVALDIVSNAADASPPGGTIELSAYTENEAYCLAIKDNGAGVPDHLREKIFEPFYTMKSGKGNGIGLAISKNIVDMHCGSIVLDSKPGETIFTVVLPLNRGEYDVRLENSRC